MKFGTVVNCTDGRVQYPVMDYLKKNYAFDFFDSANEAGPFMRVSWTNRWIIFGAPLVQRSLTWDSM